MNLQCIHCAGKGMCGRPFCPIMNKMLSQKKVNSEAKKDYFGGSPNVFVGRAGYPKVNVGLLSNETITEDHDAPSRWSGQNMQIPRLIDLRTQLINSRIKCDVKSFSDRFIEMAQEVSQAKKAVDVEINLNKKPIFNISFNQGVSPFGPSVGIKKAQITENPKIPRAIDKVVSDDSLKSVDAMSYLSKKGFDEHYLTKLISVGNLGVKKDRKIVPTRWSITATDDILGKQKIKIIKDYPEQDYSIFFGGYLGNYYMILCFPDIWSYELFETTVPGGEFMTDHEGYKGRKEYAKNTVGGYYAARLAILEHLEKIKRQGAILCLRFITQEYWAPLGVWVVREATRKAMMNVPRGFEDKKSMINHAKQMIKDKFGFDISNIINNSKLLREMREQKKLSSFFMQ